MSQHPPQHPTDPHDASPGPSPTPGIDPTHVDSTDTDPTDTHLTDTGLGQADVVAGDPPVPLTVWRTARTGADTGRIGARLAARLVAAYSRPGEAVVDLTDHHALAGACAAGGRRHHPARFTDTTELIIDPTTPPPPRAHGAPGGTEELDAMPELGGWFGDDLTDPDLPPAGGPVTDLPDGGPLHEATSLIVACWPLQATDAGSRILLERLLFACGGLLGPGGCLILLIASPPTPAPTPQDFSDVVAAAADAGLGYLQHIVAVLADTSTDGDAFVYHLRDEELLTLATADPHQRARHLRVHADLFVFARPEPRTTPRRPGHGGGRRG